MSFASLEPKRSSEQKHTQKEISIRHQLDERSKRDVFWKGKYHLFYQYNPNGPFGARSIGVMRRKIQESSIREVKNSRMVQCGTRARSLVLLEFLASWLLGFLASRILLNMPFGMSLLQTGLLDLSPSRVLRVGQCLYSRTLGASRSIGFWDNRWN